MTTVKFTKKYFKEHIVRRTFLLWVACTIFSPFYANVMNDFIYFRSFSFSFYNFSYFLLHACVGPSIVPTSITEYYFPFNCERKFSSVKNKKTYLKMTHFDRKSLLFLGGNTSFIEIFFWSRSVVALVALCLLFIC